MHYVHECPHKDRSAVMSACVSMCTRVCMLSTLEDSGKHKRITKVERTSEISQSDTLNPTTRGHRVPNEPMNKSEGVIGWQNLQYRIEVC